MSEPPNTCHRTCEAAAFKALDVQSEPQSDAARACSRVQQPTRAKTAGLSLQLHILCFGKLLEWDSTNACIPVCISVHISVCIPLCTPLCTSLCICTCRSQSTAGHGSVALLALCRGQIPRSTWQGLANRAALWTPSKPPLPFLVIFYSAKVGQALLMCLSGCLQSWQGRAVTRSYLSRSRCGSSVTTSRDHHGHGESNILRRFLPPAAQG